MNSSKYFQGECYLENGSCVIHLSVVMAMAMMDTMG